MRFDSYPDVSASLAAELVNTFNMARGRDKLDMGTATALLVSHGMTLRGPLSDRDLAELRDLRGRLRAIFTATEKEAVEQLNGILDETGCAPQLVRHDDEPWHLHVGSARHSVIEQVTSWSSLGLLLIIRDEGMERLKLCAGSDCADVFVDVSRNRSRKYCSPQVCGNRANVRAYRARQKDPTA